MARPRQLLSRAFCSPGFANTDPRALSSCSARAWNPADSMVRRGPEHGGLPTRLPETTSTGERCVHPRRTPPAPILTPTTPRPLGVPGGGEPTVPGHMRDRSATRTTAASRARPRGPAWRRGPSRRDAAREPLQQRGRGDERGDFALRELFAEHRGHDIGPRVAVLLEQKPSAPCEGEDDTPPVVRVTTPADQAAPLQRTESHPRKGAPGCARHRPEGFCRPGKWSRCSVKASA